MQMTKTCQAKGLVVGVLRQHFASENGSELREYYTDATRMQSFGDALLGAHAGISLERLR